MGGDGEDFKEPVSRCTKPLFERPCHTGDLRRQALDIGNNRVSVTNTGCRFQTGRPPPLES